MADDGELIFDVKIKPNPTIEAQLRALERRGLNLNVNVGGLQGLGNGLGAAGAGLAKFNQGLGQTQRSAQGAALPLGRLTGNVTEFDKSLEAANARVIAFGASAAIFGAVALTIKSFATNAIEVEKSLTDINVLLGLSSSSLADFGSQLFDVAKNTGTTFGEVAKAATEFSRQGLTATETIQRTNDALVLARLSGLGAAASVDVLTASVNSFSKEGLTTTDVVNRLATVDARFAVGTKDLAGAIQRAGTSVGDAGNSFNEFISLVTLAQEKTARGGAVIGNAIKSIFNREGKATTLAQLDELGIAVRDVQGNTLPAITVLTNLANKYDSLEGPGKNFVTQLVGGSYQANILRATLSGLSGDTTRYAQILGVANSAQDAAIERNKELNKTLSSQLNEAVQNATRLSALVGKVVFTPVAKSVVGKFNDITGEGNLNEKSGQSLGSKFGIGLLNGLGGVLSGPGAAVGAVLLGKLSIQFATFTAKSLAGLAGIGGASAAIARTQAGLNILLQKDASLRAVIEDKTINEAQKLKLITTELEKQVIEEEKRLALRGKIVDRITKEGFEVGQDGRLKKPSKENPTFTQRVKNGFLGDGGQASQTFQNRALIAGFAAPFIGSALSESFGQNDQQKRGIQGVGNSVGLGATIASFAPGPIGLGIAGLVTAFNSLSAVVNNLTPSFEDLKEGFNKENEIQDKRVAGFEELSRNQDAIEAVKRDPNSGGDIKKLISERAKILSRFSKEDRDLLGQDFSNKKIFDIQGNINEKLGEKKARDEATTLLRKGADDTTFLGLKKGGVDEFFKKSSLGGGEGSGLFKTLEAGIGLTLAPLLAPLAITTKALGINNLGLRASDSLFSTKENKELPGAIANQLNPAFFGQEEEGFAQQALNKALVNFSLKNATNAANSLGLSGDQTKDLLIKTNNNPSETIKILFDAFKQIKEKAKDYQDASKVVEKQNQFLLNNIGFLKTVSESFSQTALAEEKGKIRGDTDFSSKQTLSKISSDFNNQFNGPLGSILSDSSLERDSIKFQKESADKEVQKRAREAAEEFGPSLSGFSNDEKTTNELRNALLNVSDLSQTNRVGALEELRDKLSKTEQTPERANLLKDLSDKILVLKGQLEKNEVAQEANSEALRLKTRAEVGVAISSRRQGIFNPLEGLQKGFNFGEVAEGRNATFSLSQQSNDPILQQSRRISLANGTQGERDNARRTQLSQDVGRKDSEAKGLIDEFRLGIKTTVLGLVDLKNSNAPQSEILAAERGIAQGRFKLTEAFNAKGREGISSGLEIEFAPLLKNLDKLTASGQALDPKTKSKISGAISDLDFDALEKLLKGIKPGLNKTGQEAVDSGLDKTAAARANLRNLGKVSENEAAKIVGGSKGKTLDDIWSAINNPAYIKEDKVGPEVSKSYEALDNFNNLKKGYSSDGRIDQGELGSLGKAAEAVYEIFKKGINEAKNDAGKKIQEDNPDNVVKTANGLLSINLGGEIKTAKDVEGIRKLVTDYIENSPIVKDLVDRFYNMTARMDKVDGNASPPVTASNTFTQ